MTDHLCEPSRFDQTRCRHCAALIPVEPPEPEVQLEDEPDLIDHEGEDGSCLLCGSPTLGTCQCAPGELMEAWGK